MRVSKVGLSDFGSQEQRRQAEKRRQLQAAASAGLPSSSSFLELISREEMEQKARASAAEAQICREKAGPRNKEDTLYPIGCQAKRERELRKKAKAFLAAEGVSKKKDEKRLKTLRCFREFQPLHC